MRKLIVITKKGLVCQVNLKDIIKLRKGDEVEEVFISVKKIKQ